MSPISSKSYPVEFYPSKNEVTLPFLILKQHFRYSKELQLAQTGEGCSVQREAGESGTDEGRGHWVRMEKNSWNTFGVPGTQERCMSLRVSLCPVEDTGGFYATHT